MKGDNEDQEETVRWKMKHSGKLDDEARRKIKKRLKRVEE